MRTNGQALGQIGQGKVIMQQAGEDNPVTGCLGVILNIIWFLAAGWYIALIHVISAAFEAITIIGIPFAYKDIQLAQLALAPVGKMVVDKP